MNKVVWTVNEDGLLINQESTEMQAITNALPQRSSLDQSQDTEDSSAQMSTGDESLAIGMAAGNL
jgi:hypothetical protein